MFNRNKEFYTVFRGETGSMSFVSTKPVAAPGPALCRLSLRGSDVVLEEAPIYAEDNNYLDPTFETKARSETVLFSQIKILGIEYFQGEKRVDQLKEEMPTLVKISLVGEDGTRQEYYCRLQCDYKEKKLFLKALDAPV
jgi:hypothetical protein